MAPTWRSWVLAVCAAYLPFLAAAGAAEPAYQILLRSRSAEASPEKCKDADTGGGYIDIDHRQRDTVVFMMRGSAAAAAGQHKGGSASVHFVLDQDFEIVPLRPNLRPPRLILVGQVIGTLQSTEKGGGAATQGEALAVVNGGGQPLLTLCFKPHTVGTGQRLFVNDRQGPIEADVVPGMYCLHETFDLNVVQAGSLCHANNAQAAAVFDPEPGLGSRWNQLLRPFNTVPHKDFGFGVLLKVVEETSGQAAVPNAPERLPVPQRKENTQ
jgi:hypothetical protein